MEADIDSSSRRMAVNAFSVRMPLAASRKSPYAKVAATSTYGARENSAYRAMKNPATPRPIQTAAWRRILSGELSAGASGAGPSNLASISGGYSREVNADQHTARTISAPP